MQDTDEPISHIHFTAEGEVTFKSILFVPAAAPRGLFDEYGSKKNDFIKVHSNDWLQSNYGLAYKRFSVQY